MVSVFVRAETFSNYDNYTLEITDPTLWADSQGNLVGRVRFGFQLRPDPSIPAEYPAL